MQNKKPRPKSKGKGSPSKAQFPGFFRARAFKWLSFAARLFIERFPLTPLGLFAAAAASLGLIFIALPYNDLVLLVICGSALALIALALLCSITRALILFVHTRRLERKNKLKTPEAAAPLKLECGAETSTDFSLPGLAFIPLSRAAWQWEKPEAGIRIQKRQKGLHEAVTPKSRARVDEVVRRIEIGDTFGFTKIILRARQNKNVRIYPWIGQLRAPAFAHTFAEGGDIPFPQGPAQGEPSDFRRYVMGDPVRFILWKTFAKSRQLVVRTPEQAYSPVRRTVAYLVTGERDEASAAVARAALESGSLGTGWIFGADGSPEVASDRSQALEVLASSKQADAQAHANQGGTGLHAFLGKHADKIGTRVVLFVPPAPGPWLSNTLAAIRKWQKNPKSSGRPQFAGMKMNTGMSVLCGLDGFSNPLVLPWYRRLLFVRAAPENESPVTSIRVSHQELASVVNALSREGAQMAIVDRRTGRISQGAQTRLLFSAIFSEEQPGANTKELKKKSPLSKNEGSGQKAPPAERTP